MNEPPPPRKQSKKVTRGGGPARTVDISFKNVSVVVNENKKAAAVAGATKKWLLDKVSGFVPAGEILIIMGPSGCGKSECFLLCKTSGCKKNH